MFIFEDLLLFGLREENGEGKQCLGRGRVKVLVQRFCKLLGMKGMKGRAMLCGWGKGDGWRAGMGVWPHCTRLARRALSLVGLAAERSHREARSRMNNVLAVLCSGKEKCPVRMCVSEALLM